MARQFLKYFYDQEILVSAEQLILSKKFKDICTFSDLAHYNLPTE